MEKRIVILGCGTGGTLLANRLRRTAGPGVRVTVVDQDDNHLCQPGLLFVPFGLVNPGDLVRPRGRQLHHDIEYWPGDVHRVDPELNRVYLTNGQTLDYEVLVIASGARLLPEETDGLTGSGWLTNVFTFYTLSGATALAAALAGFDGGRLAVNVVDPPIKCPVAPLEFCFLADWHFRQRGIRDKVRLTYVTPLDGAFTTPVAARALAGLLDARDIRVVTEFHTGAVDGAGGRLVSFDDRVVDFDLGVVVPLHAGASFVGRSPGLADAFDFVPADRNTLRSAARPNIFVIGDAAAVPSAKAGSVAYFQGKVVARNIVRHLSGQPLDATFDGHANCFIESGFGRALLIDFNYDSEPLPGRFPGKLGLPLLKESRLNHLGRRMFGRLCWHALLRGHDIPGIPGEMPRRGKPDLTPAGRRRVETDRAQTDVGRSR